MIVPWALVVWTVAVWGTRIRNILGDDSLSGSDMAWRLAMSIGLVLLGLATGLALWNNRPQVRWCRVDDEFERLEVPQSLRRVVSLLAVVGSVVWLVRGIQIGLADHPGSFKLVHSALALGTIGLSWAAVWSIRPRQKAIAPAEVAEPTEP